MKTRNKVINTLILLSFLGLLSILLMPAQFPMQYAAGGAVSRWGSRYEFLLYWMIPAAFGIAVKGYIAYRRRRQGVSADERLRNEKPLQMFAIAFMLFYDIILIYTLLHGFTIVSTGAASSSFPFLSAVTGLLGIVIIVAGNYTPKIAYRSMIGFKNAWSTANESAWDLTHRWLGRLFVLFGFMLLLFAVVSPSDTFSGVLFLVAVLSIVAASYLLSYIAYQRTKAVQ